MSKYYKGEDVIKCVAQYIMTDAKRENPYVCGDIEDYIEFTEAILADLPTIEVSEDCISREYLLSKVYEMDNDNLVVDLKDIENAPSVVPRLDKEDLEDIYEHISESYIEGYMDGHAEGEWIDTEVFNENNDDHYISAWQSARCSNCGK